MLEGGAAVTAVATVPGLIRIVITLRRDDLQIELGLWIAIDIARVVAQDQACLLYTSPSPRDS